MQHYNIIGFTHAESYRADGTPGTLLIQLGIFCLPFQCKKLKAKIHELYFTFSFIPTHTKLGINPSGIKSVKVSGIGGESLQRTEDK
jgi:hypothetical protein